MAAVDEILAYERSADDDFYGLLGCDENSTVEQITSEYRALALQCHPDKSGGDKEAEARFQKLLEAKETLCDPAKKSNYDKWRNSGISISYKQWLGMKEHVQQTMHWAAPKTKDRMIVGAGGAAGGSGSTLGTGPAAARRASEGGAAHWGRWSGQGQEPPSEVVSKFRNYEI